MALLQRAEDVAAELKTRLQAVTVANGAETDIGVSVLQGRRRLDESQIPCTVIIEGNDAPDRVNVVASYQLAQQYVLMAYLPCDPDNPNIAAHKALRDLKRAVFLTNGRPDPRWGGKVKDVEYLGRDIGPREDGSAFVLALIEVAVTYVENLAAP